MSNGETLANSGLFDSVGVEFSHISSDAEQALLEIRDRIESIVSRGQRPSPDSRSLLVTAESARAALGALQRLLGEAKHSVNVLVPSDRSAARLRIHVLSQLAGEVPDGVRVRVLDSQATADRGRLAELQRRRPGIEVRLGDAALTGAIVIDAENVLTRSEGTGNEGPRHIALVRAPAVVDALNALFTDAWERGVPLAEEQLRRQVPQDILRCLCEGYTDDAAARALSISVRTYRRHVAEIMRVLGAGSRFQAGVRAAEMGLLRGDRGADGGRAGHG